MKAQGYEGTTCQSALRAPEAAATGAAPAPVRSPRMLRGFSRLYFLIAAGCFSLLLSGAMARPQGQRQRSFNTDHYVIYSDLDDALTREMSRELEMCYGEFSRRLSMFEESGRPGGEKPFEVYLFAKHADYVTFSGGEFPNTGGLFISKKRALAVYLQDQGREQMRKTLRHEAFHQFAFEKIGAGLPIWINEGLAQLFEEGIRVGEGLRIGMVPPERLRQLQHDVSQGRLLDVEVIMRLNDDAWSRTLADRGRAATQYTQAWAMIHFLVFALDADGKPLFRDRFNNMLRDIAGGKVGWVAYQEHFGNNTEGFRQRFTEYVQGLKPTPESKTLEHQRVLAELLVLLKARGQSFGSVEEFRRHVVERRYRLESRRDEVTWSTDADVGVYFRDISGRMLDTRQLRFQPDPFGEMPSLIRRPGDGLVYRTHFYDLEGRLMHETMCELELGRPEVTALR